MDEDNVNQGGEAEGEILTPIDINGHFAIDLNEARIWHRIQDTSGGRGEIPLFSMDEAIILHINTRKQYKALILSVGTKLRPRGTHCQSRVNNRFSGFCGISKKMGTGGFWFELNQI